jgi:hypothetical protein
MKNWELIVGAGICSYLDGISTLWLMDIAGVENRGQYEANPVLSQLIEYPNFFLGFKLVWPIALLCLMNLLGERGEKWAGRLAWFAIFIYFGITCINITAGANINGY